MSNSLAKGEELFKKTLHDNVPIFRDLFEVSYINGLSHLILILPWLRWDDATRSWIPPACATPMVNWCIFWWTQRVRWSKMNWKLNLWSRFWPWLAFWLIGRLLPCFRSFISSIAFFPIIIIFFNTLLIISSHSSFRITNYHSWSCFRILCCFNAPRWVTVPWRSEMRRSKN